jgi:hypothetical protein
MSGKLPFLSPTCLNRVHRHGCALFTTKESSFSVSVPKSGHALQHNSEFQNYTHYEVNYVPARRKFSLGFSNEEGRPGVARGASKRGWVGGPWINCVVTGWGGGSEY